MKRPVNDYKFGLQGVKEELEKDYDLALVLKEFNKNH